MENNVFKTGAVMDLVANSEVVDQKVETLEDVAVKQQTTSRMYLGKTRTIVREYNKISRNDACPCGSGKKYKNCCLHTGKFEKNHTLTALEAADVKNGKRQLSSISKDAFNIKSETTND